MRVKRNILIILSILAFIAVLVVNTLAVTLPINNKSTGELADNQPNLFVPAGVTFSIWSVIYLLLLFFVIYQAVPLFKKDDVIPSGVITIRLLFIASCLMNVGWIFAWHYELIFLSVLVMLAFLVILIGLYLTIQAARKKAAFTWKEHAFLAAPFSVYLGWITVATIANITALLVSVKWDGWGIPDFIWTIVMIGAALAIGLIMLFREHDYLYNLVLVWALAGIIIKRSNPAFPPQPGIVLSASIAIGLLVAGFGVHFITQRMRKRTNPA